MQDAPAPDCIRFGSFELDRRSGQLRNGETRQHLSDQPLAILKALAERPGELVTREELSHRLWPDGTFVSFDHGLNSAINRLREVLSDSAEYPRFIETIPRRGYRLLVPVEVVGPTVPVKTVAPPLAPEGRAPRLEVGEVGRDIAPNRSALDPVPHRSAHGWIRPRWMVAAALIIIIGGAMLLRSRRAAPTGSERVEFPILPAEGTTFTPQSMEFALSPDGRHVAFVTVSKAGSLLWVRSLAALNPRLVPGTEGARNPFWSADSQSIGFFAGQQVKTVPASGESQVVSFPWSSSFPRAGELGGFAPAGSWNGQDVIVFGPSIDGVLYQINVRKGGTPTPVTKPEPTRLHRWPSFLPDGQHFVYGSFAGPTTELRVGSLTTTDTVVLGRFESMGTYAAGRLFFVRGGQLMTQSLNEKTLQLEGDPVRLGVLVRNDIPIGNRFSVSPGGRLIFVPPPRTEPQLTWVDRGGRPVGTVGDPGVFVNLDLSPDGRQLAVAKLIPGAVAGTQTDIWLIDLATGTATRLTDDPGGEFDPAWSPDGKYIVFNSNRLGPWSLFMRASDGTGADLSLLHSDSFNYTVAAWSPANVMVFNAFSNENPSDLWTMSMSGDRTPKAFLSSKHSEMNGTFSPDGRWIAYQSDVSGRYEIVVRPFPSKDPAQTISRDGGMYPRWRGDGKELFFVSLDGTMMAAGFDATAGVPKTLPEPLFQTALRLGINRPYAVDKSGERFLLPIAPDPRLVAIMDWRVLLDH